MNGGKPILVTSVPWKAPRLIPTDGSERQGEEPGDSVVNSDLGDDEVGQQHGGADRGPRLPSG